MAGRVTEPPAFALSGSRKSRCFEYAALHAKDSKTGTMLALNGALLALLALGLFSEADTVARVTARFGVETWGMLSLMCVTLTASIVGTLAGLWMRNDSNHFDVGFACGATTLVLFLGATLSYLLHATSL